MYFKTFSYNFFHENCDTSYFTKIMWMPPSAFPTAFFNASGTPRRCLSRAIKSFHCLSEPWNSWHIIWMQRSSHFTAPKRTNDNHLVKSKIRMKIGRGELFHGPLFDLRCKNVIRCKRVFLSYILIT